MPNRAVKVNTLLPQFVIDNGLALTATPGDNLHQMSLRFPLDSGAAGCSDQAIF